MRSWSIPAGRILGVDLRIHLWFLLVLLFVSIGDRATNAAADPMRATELVAIIFASVVLHELGQTIVGRMSGMPPRAIVLYPIGGVTIFDEAQPSVVPDWKRDIRIAATGPFVNFAIAAIAALVIKSVLPQSALLADSNVTSKNLPHALVWVNIWLGAFNLLPAFPLDGGRVLRAYFGRKMDQVNATRRAVSIGRGFAAAFCLAGIWNTWFLLVGALLFSAAQMEDRSAVFQSVLETVRLEDIMLTEFATLSPADTLEDALEKAMHCLQDDFPVIRGVDMVGVVSKQKIVQALRSEGNAYVQSVMNRLFDVAPKSDTLASAFRKLSARNASILPIVHEQQLVGIVTLQNLMHSMALLAERRNFQRLASDL